MQEIFFPFLSTLLWLSSIFLYPILCPKIPSLQFHFPSRFKIWFMSSFFQQRKRIPVFRSLLIPFILHRPPHLPTTSPPPPPHLPPQNQSVWRLRCRLDDRRMEVRCSHNSRDICLHPSVEICSEVQVIGESLPHWQNAWCTTSSLTHGTALTLSHTSWWRGA